MWALTKYCAERTHFTPNIPLKILLSLVTAAVAVATYSVVFAFAVVKLIAVPLYRGLRYGWNNADDIGLAVIAGLATTEEQAARFKKHREECLQAIDDDYYYHDD